MIKLWSRDRASLFYLCFALSGLTVVALGFGVTYLVPMARGTFSAPWYVHLHGASALSWIFLLIVQATLVRGARTPVHRYLGQAAIPLSLVIWGSGVATGLWAASRDLPEMGTAATSSFAGTVTGLSLYLFLVIGAVAIHGTTDWHKRLIMLATIQLLWPAFFRLRHLLPTIPNPDIWFGLVLAYLPILVATGRDYWCYGRIHPVWLFIGPAVVIEQSLEFMLFDQRPLRQFGQWIFAFLT